MRRHYTMSNEKLKHNNSIWYKGNQILYDLCRENPRHDDLQMTVAKSWLIGRTYSVALERRYKSVSGGRNTEIWMVYKDFHNVWQDSDLQARLDKEIAKKTILSFNNLGDIHETLKLHKDLTNSIRGFSGQGISFSSKYLHFHVPQRFPIYDQISKVELKKLENLYGGYTTRSNIEAEFNDVDDEYLVFCWNLLKLKNFLEQNDRNAEVMTFREIDDYLQNCKEKAELTLRNPLS